MQDIITLKEITKYAQAAMMKALDYMQENQCESIWSGRQKAGWHEQWKENVHSGLYATCAALTLYSEYYDRYERLVRSLIPELKAMYTIPEEADSSVSDAITNELSKKRRKRYESNTKYTLKAVYYLEACLKMEAIGLQDNDLSTLQKERWKHIEKVYETDSQNIPPARDNREDRSILTTIYTYILTSKIERFNSKTNATHESFKEYIRKYTQLAEREHHKLLAQKELDRFERYKTKRNFVAALFALAHTPDAIQDEAEIANISDAVFYSLKDGEVRAGFTIKDSFRDASSGNFSWETLLADSRLLYLDAVFRLMRAGILPMSILEFFIDDIEDVIETINSKSMYLPWDGTPMFSHHIRGLFVLQSFIELMQSHPQPDITLLRISPYILRSEPRSIDRKSVVMFMSFAKKEGRRRYRSTYLSVQDVLHYLGFDLWISINDVYDTPVMDRIMDRMSKAQFIIVDCSQKSENVFYEIGISHGFGKKVFICSHTENSFPYGVNINDGVFSNTIYEKNTYPYQDLQRSLVSFIQNNLESFYMTRQEKDCIISKVSRINEIIKPTDL